MIKLTDTQTQFLVETLATLGGSIHTASIVQRAKDAVAMISVAKLAAENPRYEHDCHACTFLGRRVDLHRGEVDLYHCYQLEELPTVIARYGDNGPDYTSGRNIPDPSLAEARVRAKAFGLSV